MTAPTGPATADHTVDVAVIGGGLGGMAAALAAAEAGCTVVLTEGTSRLGGQVTTQLVPALDEHEHIETFASASYARLRAGIRAASGGDANPGGGWVSRLCFEPAIAERVLHAMLAPHQEQGRLRVLTGYHPVTARVHADRVSEVRLAGTGADVIVRATMFCDATELGDLLPLAGVPWVIGSEGRDAYGEPHALPGGPQPAATQAITWCFAVEHLPGQDHTQPAPPQYEQFRADQPFTLDIAGWDDDVHRYRMFTTDRQNNGASGRPPFWSYRRIRRGAPTSATGAGEIAVINWVGNDYAGVSLVDDPTRASREARELSLSFLHWLQTEAPHDSGAGCGFPGLRLCPQVAGTPDGLAEAPYVRESRRLRITRPVTYHDLQPERPGAVRPVPIPDSVGTAWYSADLHPRVGAPGAVYAPTAPFQIPLRALIATRPHNVLAAAKNLGATQVAAAAYRVHAGEWSVGEAAGAVAAYCVRTGTDPRQVAASPTRLLALQRALLARGVPLAWLIDIPPGAPNFTAAHLQAVHGALAGPRLERLRVEETAAALTRTAMTSPPQEER